MLGAIPRASTFALGNATRPFVLALALADKGFPRAPIDGADFRNGLNIHVGKLVCHGVAEALGLPYAPETGVPLPWASLRDNCAIRLTYS